MQLGMIGLGRMGANMVRRLIKKGQHCVVFDRCQKSCGRIGQGEGDRSGLAAELVDKLAKPRAIC